jgi:putative DNA primase/helicase
VNGEGLRQSGQQLLVPYRDIDEKLVALGTIKPDGTKLLIRGSKPRGAFMTLGTIGYRVLICEGYATGASCYRATLTPTAIAGSAENLQSVALKIRSKYRDTEIVLMADDDRESTVNHGLIAAEKAAAMAQGIVLIPTDFNIGD